MNGASGLAWGRGNGWAVYSLAETLKNLPADSCYRRELAGFFRELSQGYLQYQAESGMWRQLIDCGDSYEEASVTAMILYAFSLAVSSGFADNQAVLNSADRAANALINKCIDKNGNVYGVCRGSYCSFDAEYYKTLLWKMCIRDRAKAVLDRIEYSDFTAPAGENILTRSEGAALLYDMREALERKKTGEVRRETEYDLDQMCIRDSTGTDADPSEREFYASSSTIVFGVPAVYNGSEDDGKFTVTDTSAFTTEVSYMVEAYNLDVYKRQQ